MNLTGISTNYDVAMARQTFTQTGAAGCPFQGILKGALKDAAKSAMDQALAQLAAQGVGTTDPASTAGGLQPTDPTKPDGKKLEAKLNESIAVGFIAPMLADALGKAQQTYFANSPAEQAYAKQLYMEMATRIGQSSKLPLARDIAKALQQRLAGAEQAATPSAVSS